MKKTLVWAAVLCVCTGLVFTGCPTDDDGGDKKKKEPDVFAGFTLTVSNIPSGKAITGASLMDPADPNTPVGIGMDIAGKGNYKFYYPATDPAAALPVDLTRPFSEPGDYVLALAEVNMSTYQHIAAYFYTGGNQGVITFPVTGPLNWNDFVEQP